MTLNLARQPFINSRPVRRLVLVLWGLSAVMVVANALFYTRHFSGQEARRARLRALAEQEVTERQLLADLESELAAADLEWQNRQVGFLNLRIAERTFPWSRLFDRLAAALPRNVRLTRLRPRVERSAGPERAATVTETVLLDLRGEARGDDAILKFVNKLFRHPAFRDPDLSSESRRDRANVIEFALTVRYLPESGEEAAAGAGGGGGDGGPAEEGAR